MAAKATLRPSGPGGVPISLTSLLDQPHRGKQRGRGGTGAHSPGRGHTKLHPRARTNETPPSTPGGWAGRQRSRALWIPGQGKQQSLLTDRWPAPPVPILLHPQSLSMPLCSAQPFSHSLQLLPCCRGQKEKGYRAEGLKSIPQPLSLMPGGLPLPPLVRGEAGS